MRERVLIVEDSATQREALLALLETNEYQVTAATNGEEARRLASMERFDLIVSDIVMPGMDGYELCKRLKTELRGECPAIMLLTSLSNPTDIIRGLEAGADNFLTKPYEEDQLLSRIQFAVANRKLREKTRAEMGVVIHFLGKTFTITSERQQILDLLLTTYEDAVLQNRKLREREEELRLAREDLALYAGSLEERLRGILTTVPDVLFSIEADTDRLLYVSPAAERVLGYKPVPGDEENDRFWRGLGTAGRMRFEEARALAMKTAEPQHLEAQYRRSDGSDRWLELTLSPALDERRNVVRLDGIARDVTDRHRLEGELRQAQKMEAIGALAGGIAHDFNNLLAAMKSMVDLMLIEGEQRGAVREGVTQLAEVVERALGLTRQLLSFSRRQEVEANLVDINDVLNSQIKMLERLIGKEVHISLLDSVKDATVFADPTQLGQVIMNLCLNARDALPRGGIVSILTDRVPVSDALVARYPWVRSGEFVRVTVRDTGTGMSKEVAARIFEPFFTTKAAGKGTGLGLAVVYGIVKQHGGFITLQSEIGKGTTFEVYLPYYAGVTRRTRAKPASAAALLGGTETILLVDDEELLRRVGRKILERLGYTVYEAGDGDEALKVLAQQAASVQLVLADVSMPRTNGIALREAASVQYPHLKWILASGYSPGSSVLGELQVAGVAILNKPYGIAELARVVRQVLDGVPAQV